MMDNETAAEFALMRAQIEALAVRVAEIEALPEGLLKAFAVAMADAPPLLPAKESQK